MGGGGGGGLGSFKGVHYCDANSRQKLVVLISWTALA